MKRSFDIMQCKNHPTENGVNTCNECGSWICDSCSFERGGRIFCPNCAAQQAKPTPPTKPHIPHSDRGYDLRHVDKTVSWGILFLFTVMFPPGVNYMYLGLIKRGLLALASFFGMVYMMVTQLMQFGGGAFPLVFLFIFAIPILWLTCAFDGFRIRTRLSAGEVVTDNIDDITAFIKRNRGVIAIILLVIFAIPLVNNMIPVLARILRNLVPICLAIWAIKALFNKKTDNHPKQ